MTITKVIDVDTLKAELNKLSGNGKPFDAAAFAAGSKRIWDEHSYDMKDATPERRGMYVCAKCNVENSKGWPCWRCRA